MTAYPTDNTGTINIVMDHSKNTVRLCVFYFNRLIGKHDESQDESPRVGVTGWVSNVLGVRW
jgi:hypothetical protein